MIPLLDPSSKSKKRLGSYRERSLNVRRSNTKVKDKVCGEFNHCFGIAKD